MAKPQNPFPNWPGFDTPHYTQVPDELFDLWLPHLSGAELKTLLYICRRTFGWKKDADAISLAQITRGIRRADGSAVDRGTGLAMSTVVEAIKGLIAKGLILAVRQQAPNGGDAPTVYQPRIRLGSSKQGDSIVSENRRPRHDPLTENRRPPSPINGKTRLRRVNTQETTQQETLLQKQLYKK